MTVSKSNGAFSPKGLDGLLQENSGAQQYFASLPEYVQEMILQRRQNIQSEDKLQRYAENLTQGDK